MSIDTREHPETAVEQPGADEAVPPFDAPPQEVVERPISIPLTSVAVFLSTGAAGWMCAGIFRGAFPRVIGLLGAAIGTGMVALSYRTRRPSIVQYLALPVAVVVGALLVLPDAPGGSANLPSLVSEAIRTGGVAQPPIAFDPGWRFILVLLIAVLGSACASLATGLNRAKLGIFIPVPLLFGAALLQPSDGSLVSITVALVLFLGALGVAYGVELAQEGATSGRFEARRLVRGAGVLVVLLAALAGLSQLGFLFPEAQQDQVVPPKRPEAQPPQVDRELFTVASTQSVPWRLGVLDVYDGEAWLLPPFDTSRLLDVPVDGTVPPASQEPVGDRETMEVVYTISDVEGHVVPTIADARTIRPDGFAMQFDPRTQMLRLPGERAAQGMTYTVTAPVPPTGEQLAQAPPPPPELEEFLEVPPPPDAVADLLDGAPETNLWDRLQFVRNNYFQSVIAAGAGDPIDTPPAKVAELLNGGEGTPYEITAGEVLLARWAGVPARMGYGFFGGDREGDVFSIRPKHGATWLETYFEGLGWVAIIGIPPKAKASLSQEQRQEDPNIRPTDELALIVYVPIELESLRLVFVTVRYWLARVLPLAGALLIAWLAYPGLLKWARRLVRRRRAHAAGLAARIDTSYAEFRDAAHDLNVGDPSATPLGFRRLVAPDDEHEELAWLVTRALWGDLGRDLRAEDAETAESFAQSLTRRLRRPQPAVTRMLAFGSRASLRDPYSRELFNLWPRWLERGGLRAGLRRLNPLRLLPFVGILVVVAGVAVACGSGDAGPQVPTEERLVMPERIVPDEIEGFEFRREPETESAFQKAGETALVGDGRIFTIRQETDVLGYLEVAAFRPGYSAEREEVRRGVLEGIGSGSFEPKRVGSDRIFVLSSPEQTFYLWFPPGGRYFELLVARQGFDEAERLFGAVLAFQRGETLALDDATSRVPVPDPRRGGDH